MNSNSLTLIGNPPPGSSREVETVRLLDKKKNEASVGRKWLILLGISTFLSISLIVYAKVLKPSSNSNSEHKMVVSAQQQHKQAHSAAKARAVLGVYVWDENRENKLPLTTERSNLQFGVDFKLECDNGLEQLGESHLYTRDYLVKDGLEATKNNCKGVFRGRNTLRKTQSFVIYPGKVNGLSDFERADVVFDKNLALLNFGYTYNPPFDEITGW